jgi:diguanylate cyclase (GGDEF)-like protein
MGEQSNQVEQVGPQARLGAELIKLESQKREPWLLIAFAAAVLAIAALSFLVPTSFWHMNELEIKVAPQVVFLVMLGLLMVAFYALRREAELHKLRLTGLQQALNARSEHAASMIDAVTNVFARSFLHDSLQGEIARAERATRPLCLLMCDLDDFKHLNDRYGHLMGDYVLSQVAAILKSCVRGSDYIVRYGGDEFLLVLPETDEKGAEIVRARIHQKLADWDRTSHLLDMPISLSVGLYSHIPGQSGEQDVAEADARMYLDKSGKGKAAVQAPTPAQT